LEYDVEKKLSLNRLYNIGITDSRRLKCAGHATWETEYRLMQNCETTICKIEEMATSLRDVDCEDGK
jgi:hypothetical protein